MQDNSLQENRLTYPITSLRTETEKRDSLLSTAKTKNVFEMVKEAKRLEWRDLIKSHAIQSNMLL